MITLVGNEYYVDTAAELYAWDVTSVSAFTKAYVVETGKKMILNGSKEWKELVHGGFPQMPEAPEEPEYEPELPTVSADDNGKLMTVVEGAWAKADAPVELPTVSADDNGKVLMVVDGEWAVASLPTQEEVVNVDNGET